MIYEAEKAKIEHTMQQLKHGNESRVEKKTQELMAWKEEVVQRREAAANLRSQEILSGQAQENTEKLLHRREEIAEDLIASIKEKASEYTKTPEYKEKLIQKIKELIAETDEPAFILQVRKEDMDAVQKVATESKKAITLELLPDDRIGGFAMQNMKRTYAVENTFANRIDSREYEVVRALYNEFEEVEG